MVNTKWTTLQASRGQQVRQNGRKHRRQTAFTVCGFEQRLSKVAAFELLNYVLESFIQNLTSIWIGYSPILWAKIHENQQPKQTDFHIFISRGNCHSKCFSFVVNSINADNPEKDCRCQLSVVVVPMLFMNLQIPRDPITKDIK